jgi:cytochrome c-type biogenesis protein CcmH/NrfG
VKRTVAADPDGPISRREFESAVAGLTTAIQELKSEVHKKAPGLGNLLTMGVLAVSVIVTTVRSFARLDGLDQWRQSHEQFSTMKSDAFTEGISALERLAAMNREALKEQEMQHIAIATAVNLQDQRFEQILRMKFPDIPGTTYYPLEQIGQAVQSTTNGH